MAPEHRFAGQASSKQHLATGSYSMLDRLLVQDHGHGGGAKSWGFSGRQVMVLRCWLQSFPSPRLRRRANGHWSTGRTMVPTRMIYFGVCHAGTYWVFPYSVTGCDLVLR